MHAGHLLLATMALCCVPALAQDSPLTKEVPSSKVQLAPEISVAPAVKPDEPWRIIPKSDKDRSFLITPEVDGQGIGVAPAGPLASDFTCLSIRSYVVKRDSKNSDSVHPTGYTTCVPAKRFRLKTADATGPLSLAR